MRQRKHLWATITYTTSEIDATVAFFKSRFLKISHAWQISCKIEIDAISRNNLLSEIKESTTCQWIDEKNW